MGQQALKYWFWISLFLIAVVYFAGLTTDAESMGGLINKLAKTFTGRNDAGEFAGYPH